MFLGCAGVLDLSRATPLAPGEMRFQAGTAAGGVETTSVSPGFRFAAGVHAGLSPGLEVGGGVGATLVPGVIPIFVSDAAVDAKIRLGKGEESRVHLALNPRIRLSDWNEAQFPVTAELPLLIGFDVGAGQILTAPRAAVILQLDDLPHARPQVGVSVGWALPVSEDLEFLPAFGADWTASGNPTAASFDAGIVSFGGGISFIVVIE